MTISGNLMRTTVAVVALAMSGCASMQDTLTGDGARRWQVIEQALRADDIETAEPLVREALSRTSYSGVSDYWQKKAANEHRGIIQSLLEGGRAYRAGTLDEEPYCDAVGTFNMGTKQGTRWNFPRPIIEFAVERCNGIRKERVAAKKSATEASWDEMTAAIVANDSDEVARLATQLQAGLDTQTATSRSLKRTASAARGGKLDTYCDSSRYAAKWVAMIPHDAYVKALAGRCEVETVAKARAAEASRAQAQRASDAAKARRDEAIAEESERLDRRVLPSNVRDVMTALVLGGDDESKLDGVAFGCSKKLSDLELCSRPYGVTVLQPLDATTALYSFDTRRGADFIVLVRDPIGAGALVDGKPLPLGYYILDGTFTYDTAIGSTSTVYAIRRVE